MLNPETHQSDCWKTRISYVEGDDSVCIEHFGEKGNLLSQVRMGYEDAYDYAKLIVEIADKVIGVE